MFHKDVCDTEENFPGLENISDSHTSDLGLSGLAVFSLSVSLFPSTYEKKWKCYQLWTCHTEMKGKNTRNSISILETKGKLGSSEIPVIEYLVFSVLLKLQVRRQLRTF